jgi:hypothetical protein
MTQPSTALTVRGDEDLGLSFVVSPQTAMTRLKQLQEFMASVMVKDQDYGLIPGTPKPTLFKPGAEKLCEVYGLAPDVEVTNRVEDWEKGFFHYEVRCRLISKRTGLVVATGLGSCNSMEDRYRWRNAKRTCPDCGQPAIIKGKAEYGGGFLCFRKQHGCGAKFGEDDPRITQQPVGRVPNDDPYSLVNTILKMGKKRSLIDATLSATRSSGIFTQDVEDFVRRPIAGRADDVIEADWETVEEDDDGPPARQASPRMQQPRPAAAQRQTTGTRPYATVQDGLATSAQLVAITAIGRRELHWSEEETWAWVREKYGKGGDDLTKRDASEVIDRLKAMPAPAT